MLLGHIRRDINANHQKTFKVPHVKSLLSTPLSSSSKHCRTPTIRQPTMTKHDRVPYCYSTITLLSLRSSSDLTAFPDHLVERRFLDEENYIDLDRMLAEKAGRFDLKSFNMNDGPIIPSRIHKYDFSDPVVIQKVKNRRPKDPLTPQQVAALASVTTRHQPSTLSNIHQVIPSHVWIDDYSHQQAQFNLSRHNLPPQPLMPYQRKNPNQCELYTNQIKSLLRTYQSTAEEKNTSTIPILQRLFDAQRIQHNEQEKVNSSPTLDIFDQQSSAHVVSTPENEEQSATVFCTPISSKQMNSNKTFEWLFSANQKMNNKQDQDLFTQLVNEHLRCSTVTETPTTPSTKNSRCYENTQCSEDDDDKLKFYSPSSSPMQQQDGSPSLMSHDVIDKLCISTSVENKQLDKWFGSSIYASTYPCMPADRVLLACDFEQ